MLSVLAVCCDSPVVERVSQVTRGLGCGFESTRESRHDPARTDLSLILVNVTRGAEPAADYLRSLRATGDRTPVYIIASELKTATFAKLAPFGVDGFLLRQETDDGWRTKLARALGVDPDAPVPVASSPSHLEPSSPLPANDETLRALDVPVRALVLGRATPARARLVDALVGRRFVPHCPTLEEDATPALRLMATDPRFGVLVAYDTDLTPEGRRLLFSAIYDNPGLQVAMLGVKPDSECHLQCERLAIAVYHQSVGEEVEVAEHLVDGISEHLYDPDLVEVLSRALPELLTETRLQVHPLPPILRAGRRALASLTAMIEVGGDHVRGRAVVSGPPAAFSRIARDWLGTRPTSKAGVWDAAGELVNGLAGVVRRYFDTLGMPSHQSTPLVIEGNEVVVSGSSQGFGLVVAFNVESFAEPVFIELVLTHRSESSAASRAGIVGGGMEFL